jgi:hypothetical protein
VLAYPGRLRPAPGMITLPGELSVTASEVHDPSAGAIPRLAFGQGPPVTPSAPFTHSCPVHNLRQSHRIGRLTLILRTLA